ncbi:MAG: cell division protein FtsL [Deltaproteobacteria bacterium]
MVRPARTTEAEGKRNAKTGIRVNKVRRKKGRLRLTHRQIFITAVMLLAFMGSGIGYVWSNFEGTQIGYDLGRLRQEELRLKALNQKLRLELATLRSPQYLEEAACCLGLKGASAEQNVVLP